MSDHAPVVGGTRPSSGGTSPLRSGSPARRDAGGAGARSSEPGRPPQNFAVASRACPTIPAAPQTSLKSLAECFKFNRPSTKLWLFTGSRASAANSAAAAARARPRARTGTPRGAGRPSRARSELRIPSPHARLPPFSARRGPTIFRENARPCFKNTLFIYFQHGKSENFSAEETRVW